MLARVYESYRKTAAERPRRKHVEAKDLRVNRKKSALYGKSARQQGSSPMNTFQTTAEQANKPATGDESKPGFRTKTISMRLTPGEVAEVESAAQRAGKQPSEWLRETALTTARERPSDPIELLLAEVWATRNALLNLFHAGAQATAEGKPLLPESVLKIRDRADAKKLEQARQMLADFLRQRTEEDGESR